MPKLYTHKVHASPNSNIFTSFPIDMLRYDCLYPSTEKDSEKITNCFDSFKKRWSPEKSEGKSIIILEREGWKTWEPAYERWKSFSWTVVGHEVI